MVPSCVSDPTGCAFLRRIKSTPAMNVVATAPIPTVSTPSFPFGGAIAESRRIHFLPVFVKVSGTMELRWRRVYAVQLLPTPARKQSIMREREQICKLETHEVLN